MSAATLKASSRLACTYCERALIWSTPKPSGLTRYLRCLSPAGVSIIRRSASATSWALPAMEESPALIFAGICLTAPYVSVRAWSAAVTIIPEHRSLIRAGFENHGFDSLRGEFVAVRLGQRLERKFSGAIETHGGNSDAARAAADVHEHAAALAPHVRKHGTIYANRAGKIRVHEPLCLFR